jgi:uncharacterized protein YegP (UPF0339 family)
MTPNEHVNNTPRPEEIPEVPASDGTNEIPFYGRKKRRAVFEIAKDKNGQWHWVLWSKNGRPIATNITAAKQRHDVTRTIKNMIDDLTEAKPEMVFGEVSSDE